MKALGCLLALLLSGCITVKSAYVTLTAAETVDVQARAQFAALDKAHRADIVAKAKTEADGVAKLAAWDVTADALTKTIEGTHASVKLARDGIEGVKAGLKSKAELSSWIAPVLQAAINIKNLLAAAGVPLKVP